MEYAPPREKKLSNPLKYTFDGQFLPSTPHDGATTEPNESENGDSSNSDSSYSSSCPTAGLAASIQVIANTTLRMELAQLEMMKKRESDRLDAHLRRAQQEDEMIRMMLKMQCQVASFVNQRKRKKNQS